MQRHAVWGGLVIFILVVIGFLLWGPWAASVAGGLSVPKPSPLRSLSAAEADFRG